MDYVSNGFAKKKKRTEITSFDSPEKLSELSVGEVEHGEVHKTSDMREGSQEYPNMEIER
jgi:hypothetical protein